MSDVHYLCFILLLQLFIFKVLFHSYCLFHGVIFGRDQPFNLSVIRLYEIHFILNLWLACKNSEGNFLKSWNLFVVLVLHYTATNLTAMHTIFWKGNTFFLFLKYCPYSFFFSRYVSPRTLQLAGCFLCFIIMTDHAGFYFFTGFTLSHTKHLLHICKVTN